MLRPALILAAALLSVLWMGPLRAEEEKVSRFVEIIAPLIDPAKLDALSGKRAATPRIRKACHWLEKARREGVDLSKLIEAAQVTTGPQGTERAKAVAESFLRTRTIRERFRFTVPFETRPRHGPLISQGSTVFQTVTR